MREFNYLSGLGAILTLLCVGGGGMAWADPQSDYERGFEAYLKQDLIASMADLSKAANAGHPKAQSLLGYIHDKAEDNEQALHYYRLAAGQGEPDGEYGLATLYAAGEGVERDPVAAVNWLRKAAAQGHGAAIDALASAYLEGGLGLDKDPDQAMELLRRGAALGYEPARRRLATLAAGAVTP
jgi:TPR repeat protein